MSGPTIFAIIYSSVTIWTAVFSRVLLGRVLNRWQWTTVLVVFIGLAITATDANRSSSKDDGGEKDDEVFWGSCLVLVGSVMHGLTYVMSEAVMTVGSEPLTILQNNAIQATVASACFLVWQAVYTLPRFGESVRAPVKAAGTSVRGAAALLVGFGGSNVVHALTFFRTLRSFPGGATSAGVMKGLQAVLVFACTNLLYCGRIGGPEMCFSASKLVSLVTVCGGVLGYGCATNTTDSTSRKKRWQQPRQRPSSTDENGDEATHLLLVPPGIPATEASSTTSRVVPDGRA